MTRIQRILTALIVVIAALALLVLPFSLKRSGLDLMSTWVVMTIAAMGLNLTLGYAGQISLAQGAFVGIGAYTTAIMTVAGLPFIAAVLVSAVLCFIIGWLLGYPALRVQHHYLAFVTLAFSTLAFLVFRNEEWLTKGIAGITDVPRPVVFGYATRTNLPFYFLCLFFLVVLTLAFWGLVRSPWGRAFLALRENPGAGAVARHRYAALYADGVCDRLGARRRRRRALRAARRLYRSVALHAGALAQPADDGDRRRLGLLLRSVPRRAHRGAAARMAALHRGLLPHHLFGHGDPAANLLADRHSRHPQPLS